MNWCLVLALCLGVAMALSFDISAGDQLCFTEEFPSHTMVVVEMSSEKDSGNLMEISVSISDPDKKIIYNKYGVTEQSRYVFTAGKEGDYEICYRNIMTQSPRGMLMSSMSRRASIVVRSGSEAIDPNDSVKQEHVNVYEWELQRMEESLHSLQRDFGFMKRRDMVMHANAARIKRRVLWFSLLIIAILITSATTQSMLLKQYFKSKKIV